MEDPPVHRVLGGLSLTGISSESLPALMDLELRWKVATVQVSLDMMRSACTFFYSPTNLVSIELPTGMAYKEHVTPVRSPLQARHPRLVYHSLFIV